MERHPNTQNQDYVVSRDGDKIEAVTVEECLKCSTLQAQILTFKQFRYSLLLSRAAL
jgi:hypothetical protein